MSEPEAIDFWVTKNVPSLTNKTVIVTGGTSGIGFQTAQILAERGAEVIITGRDTDRGQKALERIIAQAPQAQLSFELIDMSDLKRVKEFCHRIQNRFQKLDILINCAGLTRLQSRQLSVDGFEMQFAANYLGHFALTAQLLPLLKQSATARIINVASIAHKEGKINFEDLQAEKKYSPLIAYRQSKLAMLIFSKELQRRLSAHGWRQISVPAHPGLAHTNIFNIAFENRPILSYFANLGVRIFGQSATMGALPILYAATAKDVEGGIYYGPKGFMDLKGFPTRAKVAPHAKNRTTAQRLWTLSETMAELHYPF